MLLLGTAGQAQEIVSEYWGFDGKVVPNRFNLLTVHLRNHTDKPIEKTRRLRAGRPHPSESSRTR